MNQFEAYGSEHLCRREDGSESGVPEPLRSGDDPMPVRVLGGKNPARENCLRLDLERPGDLLRVLREAGLSP